MSRKKINDEDIVCQECGGMNIEMKAWIDPNTGKRTNGDEYDRSDNWCRDCEDHNDFITRAEFNEKQKEE